ncbi:MAG TPA: prophage tail fiber N-terminal domain-containing protein, partial [Solirubrobacterales bacterium]|nr:prophage tail fiber N-terminal domain-containing protein [Solirubrobacterales bacterium]
PSPDSSFQLVQTCALPGGSLGIAQTGAEGDGLAFLWTTIPNTPGGWVESLSVTASAFDFAHQENFGGVSVIYPTSEYWPLPGSGEIPRYFLVRSEPPIGSEPGWYRFPTTLSCVVKCETGAHIGAHFLAATEVDPTPPVVTALEGPLVEGDVLRGQQGLHAQATDVGGGVRSLELRVDGMTMPGTATGVCSAVEVQNSSYKGLAATSPTPCPPSLSGSWEVDTSKAPFQNGPNTVQICASDFATTGSPNVSCSSPRTVEVNNACTESPVAGGADLSAGFAGAGSDDLTVKYGDTTEVEGGLTDQAGDPISGATICLESRPAGSSTVAQTVGTATTDNRGDFSMEVKPGANRQLLVGYRHNSFQVAKQLTLETRARPTLTLGSHKVRGGHKLEITGKLPKPNPGGHVLVLQGSSAHGHDWLTFKKVITGEQGRFRTTYRFTKPRMPTTFRVRVVAPAQAGYEYDSGASNAARVRVRP